MNDHNATEHAWSDDVAAYVLDALSGPERERFESHLRGCEQCQEEVDELRGTTALLAYAAPPATPPAGLRERILSEARQARPITTAPSRRGLTLLAPWLVAAASVVMALAFGWGYQSERTRRVALEREGMETRAQLAARDSTLAALLSPEVETARLVATGERAPSMQLFWNRERKLLMLTAADLPAARSGRTYQLWGIAPGQAPISLGTFNTSAGGSARIALSVPAELQLDVSAVTEEPEGGSPQPTSTPFLVGQWSRAG